MHVLSSLLCPCTLVSVRKKTRLKQKSALKAFLALAVSPQKKLVHHALSIYAVLHGAEAFVRVLRRNQFHSTHSTYEEMSFLFLKP